MIAVALAAPAVGKSYSCQIEQPQLADDVREPFELKALGLPDDVMKNNRFQVVIGEATPDTAPEATVTWPGDPIQLAGKFVAVPTSDGSFVIPTFGAGPCLFTETGCAALVQIVDQPDHTAKLLIQPSMIATIQETKARAPFVAIIRGSCTQTDSK